MADPAERKSHQCVDCDVSSPETDTNYTLISARFGWRLTRRFDATGQLVLEWRCPTCWARYKENRGMLRTPLDGVPAVSSPLRENAPGWASREGDTPPSSGTRARESSRDGVTWPGEPPSSTRRKP